MNLINLMNLAKYAIATCLISTLLPTGISVVASAKPMTQVASTPQKPATRPVDPALQMALWQAIGSDIQTQGLKLEDQEFFADYIDLNGDGVMDALVVFNSSYWCGTGGCTMLVFEGRNKSFRLVSDSTLIRTPLTVSAAKTNGWRDLIVDVRGGGATPKKVALKFDGKGYALNPSIQPSIPPNTPIEGAVLFPEGSKPQTMTEIVTQQPSAQSAKPSFDCAKARGTVETSICKDSELAALDRKLDSVYQAALKKAEQFPPKDLANFKAEQIGWIKGRNDCWKAQGTTVRNCVKENYRDRIAELQAHFALVPGQKPIFFNCNSNPVNEVVATFYQTDPPTARLERGDTTLTAFLRPTGSGAKYEGQNITFWTKGKDASMEWKGEKLQCQSQ